MQYSGSEILIKALLEHGVDTIFGYPGGAVLNIYDALYEYQDVIDHILTVDEQGACYAADGYARATGKTGVVLATSGPGATNLITGIANAYMDSVPLVAITGNVAQSLIGKDSFQEIYITGITMPITKHNFVVRNVEELAETVARAFQIANSGRKGPVLIDIPKDVTAAMCDYEPVRLRQQRRNKVDEAQVAAFAELVNAAKRPLIYAGGGLVSGNARNMLHAFMEKGSVPACHTIMGIGLLHPDDKLNLGLVGMHGKKSANMAVENCDLLIALGVRFSDRVALNVKKFAPKAKIVHVDIDASEMNKNVNVDLTIVGDARDVLEQVLAKVDDADRAEWRAELRAMQAQDFVPQGDPATLTPYDVVSVASDLMGDSALMVTDVGQHQMWAAQYGGRSQARSFITSGGLGAMGYGYGAAIGAQQARPEATVVHVTGDGSFHMNMNELATAVHYEYPIVTIILDNHALGMPRQWQHYIYNDRYALTDFFRQTDYVAMAEALGARGARPQNLAEFTEAMQAALAYKGPTVIWCEIGRNEQVLPMIPGGGTVADIIMTE